MISVAKSASLSGKNLNYRYTAYPLVIKPRAAAMMPETSGGMKNRKKDRGGFLTELDSYFSKARSNPECFGKIRKNFRQVALKRFPYVIVYEIIKTGVVVFVVSSIS